MYITLYTLYTIQYMGCSLQYSLLREKQLSTVCGRLGICFRWDFCLNINHYFFLLDSIQPLSCKKYVNRVMCLLYNVQYTLQDVHCEMLTVQSVQYTLTVCKTQCEVYSAQYSVCFTVQRYTIGYTVYTVTCTPWCTVYTIHFTVYSVECTWQCRM